LQELFSKHPRIRPNYEKEVRAYRRYSKYESPLEPSRIGEMTNSPSSGLMQRIRWFEYKRATTQTHFMNTVGRRPCVPRLVSVMTCSAFSQYVRRSFSLRSCASSSRRNDGRGTCPHWSSGLRFRWRRSKYDKYLRYSTGHFSCAHKQDYIYQNVRT